MPRKAKEVIENAEVKEVKRRVRVNRIPEYGMYYVYLENADTNELFKIKTYAISMADAVERAELIVDDVNVNVIRTVYAGTIKIPVDMINNALSLEENLQENERKLIVEVLRKANILLEVL